MFAYLRGGINIVFDRAKDRVKMGRSAKSAMFTILKSAILESDCIEILIQKPIPCMYKLQISLMIFFVDDHV